MKVASALEWFGSKLSDRESATDKIACVGSGEEEETEVYDIFPGSNGYLFVFSLVHLLLLLLLLLVLT